MSELQNKHQEWLRLLVKDAVKKFLTSSNNTFKRGYNQGQLDAYKYISDYIYQDARTLWDGHGFRIDSDIERLGGVKWIGKR